LTHHDVIHQDHDYDVKKPIKQSSEVVEAKTLKSSSASSAAANNNKKVTEFFTVRRSVRKTKKEVQAERMRTIEQAIKEEREDGLSVSLSI
jgi:histone-lysine N-methyltransferase SETD8